MWILLFNPVKRFVNSQFHTFPMLYNYLGGWDKIIFLSVFVSLWGIKDRVSPAKCTKMRIRIRASSTMVGIQAMTRSISQFLNRHSQSLSPATARPSHALQRHTGSGTFTDKETQKRLWKQEKNTFDLSHNWHFLFQLYGEWGRFLQ